MGDTITTPSDYTDLRAKQAALELKVEELQTNLSELIKVVSIYALAQTNLIETVDALTSKPDIRDHGRG